MNVSYKQSIWATDNQTILNDLAQLEIGEEVFFPESDYGHGFIQKIGNDFECYEIPMYGGEPSLSLTTPDPQKAIDEVASWT